MAKALMARLDRLLANLGYGSRKEVQALVAAGKVVLDGKVLKDAGARIALQWRPEGGVARSPLSRRSGAVLLSLFVLSQHGATLVRRVRQMPAAGCIR